MSTLQLPFYIMATQRAPKQWSLTKVEDVNSFESWKENLKYTLSLDANFAPFLVGGFQWNKVSKTDPNRGLISDPPATVINRKTAEQKVIQLNLMLGQIANYCPVITRNTIIGKSTSIDSIWQSICAHFGFQSSGGHFLLSGNPFRCRPPHPEKILATYLQSIRG